MSLRELVTGISKSSKLNFLAPHSNFERSRAFWEPDRYDSFRGSFRFCSSKSSQSHIRAKCVNSHLHRIFYF